MYPPVLQGFKKEVVDASIVLWMKPSFGQTRGCTEKTKLFVGVTHSEMNTGWKENRDPSPLSCLSSSSLHTLHGRINSF